MPAVSARAGAVRAAWLIWRDGVQSQAVTCLVGAWHVMTAGLRDVKVNENRYGRLRPRSLGRHSSLVSGDSAQPVKVWTR